MDYIGLMLNPIGKMPKTHYKRWILYWFYWKKPIHNGILMETIGISVMVSIGLLLFLLAGSRLWCVKKIFKMTIMYCNSNKTIVQMRKHFILIVRLGFLLTESNFATWQLAVIRALQFFSTAKPHIFKSLALFFKIYTQIQELHTKCKNTYLL